VQGNSYPRDALPMAMGTLVGQSEGAGLNPSTTHIVGNINPIHAHVSVQDHTYLGTPLQVVRTPVVNPQPLTVGQAGLPPVGGVVVTAGHPVSRPATVGIGVGPAPYELAAYGHELLMPAGVGSAPYEPVANGPTLDRHKDLATVGQEETDILCPQVMQVSLRRGKLMLPSQLDLLGSADGLVVSPPPCWL